MSINNITKKLIRDYRCTDPSDAMRLDMLAMELESQDHTVESLKDTTQFMCASSNFNITDDYLKELINHKNQSK